jgi:DNA-binding response OmpR family regulator
MPARVLIVEHDDKIRFPIARALRNHGLDVDETADCDEAVSAMRKNDYAVVLLASFDVLDVVRNDEHRPLILILSASPAETRRFAGDAAVLMCINKQFAVSNLDPVIAALVAVARIH